MPPENLLHNSADTSDKTIRIMFYNVENLFDTQDDSIKNDNEFLPEGSRRWNNSKMYDKINKLYKVIVAVGGWSPPDIIGLCEIENRFVISLLLNYTPLQKFNYGVVHAESPDQRGIDVAILYNRDRINKISEEFISVHFPFSHNTTRDIAYMKARVNNKDTLHIFVNHWPSRLGGEKKSEPNRMFVAGILKSKTDSIFKLPGSKNIVIMGDFNDEPVNNSLINGLKARIEFTDILFSSLYNLSACDPLNFYGTLKYQSGWQIFDQFIVSGQLLDKKSNLTTSCENFHIFNADFLLEPDEKYMGKKPFRTYSGFKYNHGYSDHLPVYLDLN